jgi:pSer/pThr/pTyr-binding forkhead associated (FHA) protein
MFPPGVFFGETNIVTTIIARTILITPIGALLGVVMGIPAKSMKQATVGLIGGAIAGAISGLAFDVVCQAMGSFMMTLSNNREIGAPGRALLAISIGLGIGLFTSLLQTATKTAWVRRIYGRNEFKEWVVDAPQTSIGRNETCHIPIHGDPSVAPIHAMIQKHQGNFFLADCGSGLPTYLNGQPIQQVPLFSGAMIQVGSAQLEFILKAGSAPQRASEQYRSQYAATPQPGAPMGYGAQQPMQPGMMQTPYNPAAQQPMQQMPTQQVPMQQQTMQAPYNPAQQPMQPSNPTTVQQPYMGQPAPTMMPQSSTLVATTGPLSGQRFPITSPIDLGRDCPAIPLSFDTMVSRRHVSLTPGAGGVMVSDLGSTNGTFVNDQRVTTATLRPGDILRVGSTNFRVEQP